MFGLEYEIYSADEDDNHFTVSVLLLEKDIALPLTLQLSATDVTASRFLC